MVLPLSWMTPIASPDQLTVDHVCDCATDSDDAQPAQKSPVTFKSWKDAASCCSEQSPQLRKMWLELEWTQFKLRSKNYLKDRIKVIPEPPRKTL